jgi:hypothetical protein
MNVILLGIDKPADMAASTTVETIKKSMNDYLKKLQNAIDASLKNYLE